MTTIRATWRMRMKYWLCSKGIHKWDALGGGSYDFCMYGNHWEDQEGPRKSY